MKASSYRRSWQGACSAALVVGALQVEAPAPVVECSLPGDPDARVYRLVDAGPARDPRWRLTLESRPLGTRVVELPLPNARVQRLANGLTVSSASSNGGLAVAIAASAGGPSTLDVFVNFELEVNVWRDLSPDVEHMNTDGPQAHARCRILSPQDSLP